MSLSAIPNKTWPRLYSSRMVYHTSDKSPVVLYMDTRKIASGRRSKIAAEALVELGYTNIKEFGGIIDWPYEVE